MRWLFVLLSPSKPLFAFVTQRFSPTNGCLNPNPICFPLFRVHVKITECTNHALPIVSSETNHVSVVCQWRQFPPRKFIASLARCCETSQRCPMDLTQKKIVESSSRCFICSLASLKNNKIFIFGKSSLNIAEVIRSSPSWTWVATQKTVNCPSVETKATSIR